MIEEAILRRIDRLESTLAIQQLAARFARATDSRDMEAWANLFVEDAFISKEKRGRAELKKLMENVFSRFYRTQHFISGHVIDFIDDDNATGTVYGRNEYEIGDKWIVTAMCYFDRYERRDGVWYFRQRVRPYLYAVDALERPNDSTNFQRWPGHAEAAPLADSFPTWKEFWKRQDPALIAELTNSPV